MYGAYDVTYSCSHMYNMYMHMYIYNMCMLYMLYMYMSCT